LRGPSSSGFPYGAHPRCDSLWEIGGRFDAAVGDEDDFRKALASVSPKRDSHPSPYPNDAARSDLQSGKRLHGRGGGIRTPDPLLPKQMRYQTALRPDSSIDCNPNRFAATRLIESVNQSHLNHSGADERQNGSSSLNLLRCYNRYGAWRL
jgi:hypothetical protein